MKRTSLVLSVLFLLAASAAVQAQYNYLPNLDGLSVTVTRYTGPGGAVFVPTNLDGLVVTGIGDDAFADCNGVSSVTIPDSVGSLGAGVFAFCDGLTNATIPDSVVSIGNGIFWGCLSLASVTWPNSVSNIADSAFYDCTSLTNVAIAESVTNIGADAFYGCTSLTNLTIPASVTGLAPAALAQCTNLAGVYFTGNAPSANATVFAMDKNVKIYYLAGTTGWLSTFAGRPTSKWTAPPPQNQPRITNYAVQNNQFGFNITGPSNLVVVVQASTNLPVWTSLQTNTLSGGLFNFSDPQWTNYPARFYRLRSP